MKYTINIDGKTEMIIKALAKENKRKNIDPSSPEAIIENTQKIYSELYDMAMKLESLQKITDLNNKEDYRIENKFKKLVDDLDESRQVFAKRIGLKGTQLSRILNNTQECNLTSFFKIWNGLGCPNISEVLIVAPKNEVRPNSEDARLDWQIEQGRIFFQ